MPIISDYFPEYAGNDEKIKELTAYNNTLDLLVKQAAPIQFNNKGRDHAILVMAKIFEASAKNIKIFARDFNGQISDNQLYLQNLEKFLNKDKDTSAQIIFETKPNEKSKALAMLRTVRKNNSKKVSLKIAAPEQIKEFKQYLVNEEGMMHFTLGDDTKGQFNKYRCETDTKNFVAILNFDDPKFCNSLNKLYSILDTNATAIN